MQRTLPTLEFLAAEADAFAAQLTPRSNEATLVTLSGELGAGKTSFTQALARTLGVTEHVTSPTFVLEKIYELPEGAGRGFVRLVHIDAYRLEGGDALAPLNFAALVQDPKNLVVLEWPERIVDALPTPAHAIALEVLPDNERSITYA
ncbi:MAG: tRNA threonylcarbamoyladenosine biosynthesis protein TsaE [Candidatus Parcubacteria bacterium]|jgi:tRNA threonylcarbamoyl adenosine modification protein YjeE|nr:tRNA threonylcarbamoyladenosine biosynthesis protein TsaE [Candidatus Parcubacteria bacterium]